MLSRQTSRATLLAAWLVAAGAASVSPVLADDWQMVGTDTTVSTGGTILRPADILATAGGSDDILALAEDLKARGTGGAGELDLQVIELHDADGDAPSEDGATGTAEALAGDDDRVAVRAMVRAAP